MATNAARRLESLTRRLNELDRVIVTTAAPIVSDALRDRAARDTGGDGRLSGMGRGGKPPRGKALDVDLKPLRNPAGVRITPSKRQAGIWAIVSSGRSAFEVRARAGRRHRPKTPLGSSRARAMRVGSGWAVGPWRVGGTRGKGTWQKGADEGRGKAIQAVRAVFHEAVSE